MRTHWTVLSFCVAIVAAGVHTARAGKLVVPITSTSLGTHAPDDSTLGSYYTLAMPIPNELEGMELLGAYLEFYTDVSANPIGENDVLNDAPDLEVYALTESFAGSLDLSKVRSRPVAAEEVRRGTNRRVRIDVQEIVAYYLKNPSQNYGLILGSLRGMRDGLFTFKEEGFPNGAFAQLTLYYARPFRGNKLLSN